MKPNQQQRLLKITDSSLFAANSALPRPVDSAPDNAGQSISKANSNVLLLKSGTSVHIPPLTPMFSSENVLNKLQGAPSNLMKVRDVVQLDGGADSSKEHLRRRIKDLERDVSKLTNHVRQAEQSIQSYRTCLSDRSPRPSNSKDFATQTDTDAVSQLQLSLKTSNDRIDRLVSELAAMRETKDLLFRERQQLSEAARGREHALQSSIAAHQETIQEQAEHLQLLRDRIAGLEASSAVDSESVRSVGEVPLPVPGEQVEQASCSHNLPILLSTVKSLRESLSSMTTSFSSQLEALRSSAAQDYHSIAVSAGIQLSSKSLQLEEQYTEMMQRLRSDNEELRLQLIAKTELLNVQAERLLSLNGLSSKSIQLVSRHDSAASPSDRPSLSSTEGNSSQKSPTAHRALPVLEHQKGAQPPFVSHSSSRHDSHPPSIESLRILQAVESCKSPKKSEFLSVVQETKYKLRLAEIEAEYSERLKQVEIKHRLQLSRQEQLAEDKMRQLEGGFRQQLATLGGERDRLTAAHRDEQLRSMGYQQRIDDAAVALGGLREVHEAEIKAVKHEAHVKDLIRVGKEREASLERDRLLSKYIPLSCLAAFHISVFDRQSNSAI